MRCFTYSLVGVVLCIANSGTSRAQLALPGTSNPPAGNITTDDPGFIDVVETQRQNAAAAGKENKVVGLKTLTADDVADLVAEIYPDDLGQVRIIPKDALHAIILRGTSEKVRNIEQVVNELDRIATDRQKVAVAPPTSNRRNQFQNVALPTPSITALNENEIQRAESIVQQEAVSTLARRYRKLKSDGKKEQAEEVKTQIRELVTQAHKAKIQRQRLQVQLMEGRLDVLKQRIQDRNQNLESIVDQRVLELLSGKSNTVVQPSPYRSLRTERDNLNRLVEKGYRSPDALAATSARLAAAEAQLKTQRVQLAQQAKLNTIALKEAEMEREHALEQFEEARQLHSKGGVSSAELRRTRAAAERAALQIEKAKVELEAAMTQMKILDEANKPESATSSR